MCHRSLVLLSLPAVASLAFRLEASSASKPTEFQAASLAKQILGEQKVGTLMVRSRREWVGDGDFVDFPYGQVEILARDCQAPRKDVLVFASPMELTIDSIENYRNNVTVHLRDYNDDRVDDPLTKHRVTLMGHAEPGPRKGEPGYSVVADCFFDKHPDARAWENMESHGFRFWRIVPRKIHYVGGFGDTHFIGWISEEDWIRAPGTAICKDWVEGGCPDTSERCCPRDHDNDMADCCASSPDKDA